MTTTYSVSSSETFSLTHARKLAAKIATDLLRVQRFYGYPSDSEISAYEIEAVELIKGGYLNTVTYGFRRNGDWITPTLRYTAREILGNSDDDDPGKVRPGADVSGASFWSYLVHSPSWWSTLSAAQREAIEKSLPFQRSGAPEPGVRGYFTQDRIYSAGGRSLVRTSVRNFG